MHCVLRLSLGLFSEQLLLEGVGLGELDDNLLGGELLEDGGHGLELALSPLSVEGVQEELGVLLAVERDFYVAAGDGRGVAL